MIRRPAAVLAVLALACTDPPTAADTELEPDVHRMGGVHASGDRGRMAFVSNRDGNPEIYTVPVSGRQVPDQETPRRLTDNPGNDGGPDWSPNGRKIAFHSAQPAQGHTNLEIYVVRAEGGDQTRLTSTTTQNMFPAWSPNGRRIAFSRGVPANLPQNVLGNRQIWVMNADGTNPLQLTFEGDNYRPRWSPDARHLVFASNRDATPADATPLDRSFGIYDIYVIDARHTGPARRLTAFPTTLDAEPDWSPDGQLIAFRSRREVDLNGDHYCAIFVMRPDGSRPRSLTPILPGATSADWCNAFPMWSRDGRHIFFHALRTTPDLGLQLELYRIDRRGGGETRLTFHPAADQQPAVR